METTEVNFVPVVTAGTILGIGLGGLLDGIIPSDYLGDWQEAWAICTWLLSGLSVIFLWNALVNPYTPRSGKVLFGSFLVGWGLHLLISNVLVNLFIKHWNGKWIEDVILIVLGVLMMIAGKLVVSRAKRMFYAELLKNSKDRGLLARPACPAPFKDAGSPFPPLQ